LLTAEVLPAIQNLHERGQANIESLLAELLSARPILREHVPCQPAGRASPAKCWSELGLTHAVCRYQDRSGEMVTLSREKSHPLATGVETSTGSLLRVDYDCFWQLLTTLFGGIYRPSRTQYFLA
jgi:hypothetical protein